MKKRGKYYRLYIACLLWGLCSISTQASSRDRQLIQADSLNAAAAKYLNIDLYHAQRLASIALERSATANYRRGQVIATCNIALTQINTSHCHEALAALQAVRTTATATIDSSLLTTLYTTTAACWAIYGKYDSADTYCRKALSFCNPQLPFQYARACILAGRIAIKNSNQHRALDYYQKARNVIDRNADEDGLACAKDLLGEIYYAQRLYEKALPHLRESHNIFARHNNRAGSGLALLHQANAYYMLMKDDSAQKAYTKALQEFSALGDSNGLAVAYSNLSRVALDAGKPEDAISYAEKALHTIRPGNYITVEAGTYQQLGDIYGELAAYDKAIAYVQKALNAARTAGNKVIVKDCYKSLSELYQAMGKPELAMQHLLIAYRMKDSIQPVLFTTQLAEMEAKYEAEKKQAEIALLKKQKQIDVLRIQQQEGKLKRQAYLLLISLLLLAVIISGTYFYISRRKLQESVRQENAIRETEERERMRIAKDIHDELGSGLSKIRFLSELAGTQAANPQQLSGSLHSISDTSRGLVENMRDLVWAMNPENTTLDNLVARIREYSHEYLEEFPLELNFDIPEDIPRKKISREVSRNVHMIVKEGLQNIVKHSGATQVTIRVTLSPVFALQISDNGKGFNTGKKTEGYGLKNIMARSKAIGGSMQMASGEQETYFILTLDKL